MNLFVTGASGFIGSAIVKELLSSGIAVTGLARSEKSAKQISDAGADVVMGNLNDPDLLKRAASQADGVIHTAFIHDFEQYASASVTDRIAIEALGDGLKGTNKPLIVTAGILGLPRSTSFITEKDLAFGIPRSSEETALKLAKTGINASVIRLPPSVHDKDDHGFVHFLINKARLTGVSCYVDEGGNRWPAVHRCDAAKLYCLAIEKGEKGALYNAITEEGIRVKEIADLIGKKLQLPVTGISEKEAKSHFEWMARFITSDSPATSEQTRQNLNWNPKYIGLLEDMSLNYF